MTTVPPLDLDLDVYREMRQVVIERGYGHQIEWSENVDEPPSAEALALDAIFVICNSGMKHTVAQGIYRRVVEAIKADRPIREAFGHPGKAAAIADIWARRYELYDMWLTAGLNDVMADTPENIEAATAGGKAYRPVHFTHRLAFCESLPWIGGITKFHLAKNLGVDCAKPDVWLVRLGKATGEDPHALCARLARASGDRIATVDLVLWYCLAKGWAWVDVETPSFGYQRPAAKTALPRADQ